MNKFEYSKWRSLLLMTLKCTKHPGYKAIHQPRSDCDRCWLRWIRKVTYEQGRRIDKLVKQLQDEAWL